MVKQVNIRAMLKDAGIVVNNKLQCIFDALTRLHVSNRNKTVNITIAFKLFNTETAQAVDIANNLRDIDSIKRSNSIRPLSIKQDDHLYVFILTYDHFDTCEALLEDAIHIFRQGRNFKSLFDNIYFFLHKGQHMRYFTLGEYCREDGFYERNTEKRERRYKEKMQRVKIS